MAARNKKEFRLTSEIVKFETMQVVISISGCHPSMSLILVHVVQPADSHASVADRK